MMRNIPKPHNATTIYKSDYIELLKINTAPEEWGYNTDGYWIHYGETFTSPK
jgi:hypothetical protein